MIRQLLSRMARNADPTCLYLVPSGNHIRLLWAASRRRAQTTKRLFPQRRAHQNAVISMSAGDVITSYGRRTARRSVARTLERSLKRTAISGGVPPSNAPLRRGEMRGAPDKQNKEHALMTENATKSHTNAPTNISAKQGHSAARMSCFCTDVPEDHND